MINKIRKVQESAITWTNKSTLFSFKYIIIRLRDFMRRYQDELSDWDRCRDIGYQDGSV